MSGFGVNKWFVLAGGALLVGMFISPYSRAAAIGLLVLAVIFFLIYCRTWKGPKLK